MLRPKPVSVLALIAMSGLGLAGCGNTMPNDFSGDEKPVVYRFSSASTAPVPYRNETPAAVYRGGRDPVTGLATLRN